MKRLILSLIVWLAFTSPCAASLVAPNRGAVTTHTCGSGTSCVGTVPTSAVNGHVLVECVMISNGAAVTSFGSGGTNAFTNLDSTTNTIRGACAYKNVVTGDPATYTASWTGAATSLVIQVDVGLNTDGTTPALDVHNITTGVQAASITTTVNGDEVLNIIINNSVLNGASGTYAAIIADSNADGYTVLASGQKTAGTPPAVSWTPGSGANAVTETIAFKANTTTAEMLVGVGAETFQSGSSTVLSLGTPTNGNTNDTLLAGVVEGTPAVAITAPPVIALRGVPNEDVTGASTTRVITTPTTVSGDLMIAHILSVGTPTPPACACWTAITVTSADANTFFYSHTSTGASEPANYTWSIAGNNLFAGSIGDFFDSSGGTLTVGAALFKSCAAGTSCLGAAVTTGHNNAAIYNYWQQPGLTTITPPTTQNSAAMPAAFGYQFGWFNLHTAGLTANQTATSGTSATWRTVEIEIYSTVAAALSASTVWTHQAPFAVTDPTNGVQLDVYSMIAANASSIGPSLFTFASGVTNSGGLIVDIGNLNTTTPVDTSNGISNAGLNQIQQAPLIQPTSTDEMALTFNGYSGCSPSAPLAGQYPSPLSSNPTGNSRISAYYTTIDAAMAAQAVDQCGGPYASITLGLNAATAPTTTSAALRINQQIEEIFALAPAPLPPAANGAWFF